MSDTQDIDATLRETYANLRGQFEGDFEAPAAAAAPAEPTEPEEVETPAAVTEPTEPEEVAEPEEGKETETPAEPTDPAQNFKPSWKKAALAEWDKLPPLVRAEVQRREEDFHRGIEQYKTGAAASQEWERAVQPYLATINGFGVAPQVAVQSLLATDHQLRYGTAEQKASMLIQLARSYGADFDLIARTVEQQGAGQPQVDPNLARIEARINSFEQQQLQAQQQAQAREHSQVDAEIAAFAADPDNEHFPVLQREMGVLLQGGLAKTLKDAYDLAMRQNPQTYPIWLAQQQQTWDAERKARVVAAKKAGANNVRPNGRASVPAAQPPRTLEEDLQATARNLGLLN